jgi:hypothetical protein
MAKRGRPPRPIDEAREFGRLIEIERGRGSQLGPAMDAVRRRSPRRWGSRSKMFDLWGQYLADKVQRARPAVKERGSVRDSKGPHVKGGRDRKGPGKAGRETKGRR